jgi:DNA-binding CsgD family transcriptional regulator
VHVLEAEVGEQLVWRGRAPGRVMVSGVGSLTSSKRRMAELAAAGNSNKEIAQALLVTVKTVEPHLTSAYRKLDVESRPDLPAVLRSAASASVVDWTAGRTYSRAPVVAGDASLSDTAAG